MDFDKTMLPEGWAALRMFVPMLPSKRFNSLPAIDGHDRQLINELHAPVVSPRIFVQC
jgi:hypothetical protein